MRLMRLGWIWILAAALGACKGKKETPAPSASKPAPVASGSVATPKKVAAPSAAVKSSTAATPATSSAKGGPAYFAVVGRGIVKLSGGKFEVVSPQPRDARQIVLTADGKLYANSFDGLYRIANGQAVKLGANRAKIGTVSRFDVARDGQIWTVSFKGVGHFDGTSWKLIRKRRLGRDVKLLVDVKVDSQGTVWVLSSNKIHSFTGGEWRVAESGSKSRRFYKQLALSSSGTLYALHSRAVLKHEGGAWREISFGPAVYSLSKIAVGGAEELHVWGGNRLYVAASGKKVQRRRARALGLEGRTVRTIAADALGRTWISTANGLTIAQRSGGKVHWAPGTVPPVAALVSSIQVVGGGPALPAVGPAQKGTVVGKVMLGGVPAAAAKVEICASPRMFYRRGASPCSGEPFTQEQTTKADGRFRFDGVPLGTYRFVVKAGAKWTMIPRSCCSAMRAGKVFDAGALSLRRR